MNSLLLSHSLLYIRHLLYVACATVPIRQLDNETVWHEKSNSQTIQYALHNFEVENFYNSI